MTILYGARVTGETPEEYMLKIEHQKLRGVMTLQPPSILFIESGWLYCSADALKNAERQLDTWYRMSHRIWKEMQREVDERR